MVLTVATQSQCRRSHSSQQFIAVDRRVTGLRCAQHRGDRVQRHQQPQSYVTRIVGCPRLFLAPAVSALQPLQSLVLCSQNPQGSPRDSTDSADDGQGHSPADQPEQRPQVDYTSSSMQGLHLGYVLVASVLIGLLIGYGIDLWLESSPWGMIAGSLFFIVAGLYQVVKEGSK